MPSRTLKESICDSDNLDKCTAEEERFFYRLIVKCEDYGRLDARPVILRSRCFPLKIDSKGNPTIKLSEIAEWLTGLAKNDLLVVYLNDGRPYLQMITWADHNQIRAKSPKYPALDDEGSQVTPLDNICNHLLADDNICFTKKQRRSDSYIRNTIDLNKDLKALKDLKDLKEGFGESGFVNLTKDEHAALLEKIGELQVDEYVERLDGYIGQIGVQKAATKYKSHYHTILNWWRKDGKPGGKENGATKKPTTPNPSGRSFNTDSLD